MSSSPRAVFASLPRTVRGKAIVIGEDPKGKKFLYTNGNCVVIRDIENPFAADIYTQHSTATTVAQYSPSGFYIASGDITGKIRIWDTVNQEHILKYEYQPLGGAISDISWSADSKRIVVGGEGRDKFANAFSWDTGTSVGTIIGHNKAVNSVTYRPDRPFRIATASEDNDLCFFEGPPFKFKFTIKNHTSFVNAVRYAPNSSVFISGGADGKCYIYDGKSGERTGELGCPAHKAGVYALSFSPDSTQVLTVSADKTAKLWDVASTCLVQEFVMGTQVSDMQVGCLWQGPHMITVSVAGHITYLDKSNPATPLRVVKGHNKPITAMAISEDQSTIYTGASDGNIVYWNAASGDNDVITGKGHTNQIQDMTIVNGELISIGMDDTIRYTSVLDQAYGAESSKLDSQPHKLSALPGGTVAVACYEHIVVLQNGRQTIIQKTTYEPLCIALHPGGTQLAVGCLDKILRIYDVADGYLTETKTMEHYGPIRDMRFSPDGAFLAAADDNRTVVLYSLPNYEKVYDKTGHTARVNCLSWSPDGNHFLSAGLDSDIVIWNTVNANFIKIKKTHTMSAVNCVGWLSDNIAVSAGHDSHVKQWNISFS